MRDSRGKRRAQRDIHSHHPDATLFWNGLVEQFASARCPGWRGPPVRRNRMSFSRASIPLDVDLFLPTMFSRAIHEPLAIGGELRVAFVDQRVTARMYLTVSSRA